MDNKTDNPLTDLEALFRESELSDRFKTILVSLNMAFEAAKAGKSGKELYLISEALREKASQVYS